MCVVCVCVCVCVYSILEEKVVYVCVCVCVCVCVYGILEEKRRARELDLNNGFLYK